MVDESAIICCLLSLNFIGFVKSSAEVCCSFCFTLFFCFAYAYMRPDGQLNLKDAAPGKPGADEEATQIVFAAVVLVKRRLSQIFVQQQKGVESHSALNFFCSLLFGSGAEVGRVDALHLKVVAQRRMQQLLVIIVLKDALGGEADVISIERGVLRFAAAAAAQLAQASGENQALRQRCPGGIAEGVPGGVGSESVDLHVVCQKLRQ